MKYLILIITLLAFPAWADTSPPDNNPLPNQGREATLCKNDLQSATFTCQKGGDEIVWDVRGYKTITFDATLSTAATFTCDVQAAAVGRDAMAAISESPQDVTATSISDSARILTLEGGFRFIWIICSASSADNTGVTIWATAIRG